MADLLQSRSFAQCLLLSERRRAANARSFLLRADCAAVLHSASQALVVGCLAMVHTLKRGPKDRQELQRSAGRVRKSILFRINTYRECGGQSGTRTPDILLVRQAL